MSEQLFTLCFATAAGVVLVVLASRIKVPSIALLLLAGIAVGPEGLGIIDPWVLGDGLQMVVGMAVAVILFEGGLTLDLQGARHSPVIIGRMLTIGVVITWLGTAIVIWAIFGFPPGVSLLAGSLVIVTGPTVVSPLLRRIGVRERLKHILYWEAVLIDAIGVFVAVLCFEWISPDAAYGTWSPILRFALRVAVGAGIGLTAGAIVALVLRYHLIEDEQVNIFVLAMALLTYAGCEAILHESGILAVIVAGLVIGLTRPRHLDQLKRFKLELTELGIGTLFILLAATLRLEPFLALGSSLVLAVAVLVFVLRPMVIVASTWGRGVSVQEKIFLSWIAPRGIVAAFMASLFALALAGSPQYAEEALFLQTFTFAVIITTVILQGLTAPWVARILRLEKAPRRTWLIIGDEAVALAIADALNDAGGHAIALVPEHAEERAPTQREGLVWANPLDKSLFDDPRFADVGAVVTVSPNLYFNQLVCERWAEIVGAERCFRTADAALDEQPAALGFAGQPVWPALGDHAQLIQGLESGSLAISPVEPPREGDEDRFGSHLVPLLAVAQEHATIVDERHTLRQFDGSIIALRRRVPGLENLVEDAVVIDEPSPTLELVVSRLLERAAARHAELPKEELERLIVERERSMPTAMGTGVAIPHAYHATVQRAQCYVANVPRGIEMGSPDGAPVLLVFLVLSPVGQAESHLRSLAAIAQLANEPSFLRMLERQTSASRVLARIRERA